jgi:hypothetical protein
MKMKRIAYLTIIGAIITLAACSGKDGAPDLASRDLQLVNGQPLPPGIATPEELQQLPQSSSGQWIYIPAGYTLMPTAAVPSASAPPVVQTVVRPVAATRVVSSARTGTVRSSPAKVTHTRRDAVIGAAAGGITGAVIDKSVNGAVIGAVAGGALGAAVGTWVDVSRQ